MGEVVGVDGEGLAEGGKAGMGDGDDVVAEGKVGESECAVGAGIDGLGEGGVGRGDGNVCAGDRTVLGIVDDALKLGEDGGADDRGERQTQEKGEAEGFQGFQGDGLHGTPRSSGSDEARRAVA
jgi:hypothetical protein